MTWRSGTATIAALSLAILPLSMAPANADDTIPSTPTPSAPATTSTEPVPSSEAAPATGEAVAARTIIVTFDKAQADPAEAAEDAVARIADQVADAQVSKVDPITDSMVAVTLDAPLSAAESAGIEDRVSDAKGVKAAETARWFRPMTTNDTYYSPLWNLNSAGTYGVHAEDAWPTSTGANAIVGVVDTGITAHPDLTGSTTQIVGGNAIEGYDFIADPEVAGDGDERDSDPSDPGDFDGDSGSSWHGTHVTGIIAALASNGIGVAGVAPNAKVEPLRVLGPGGGSETDVIAAILWGSGIEVEGLPLNAHPVDVLNLSLGAEPGPACSAPMQAAIDEVSAKGVVVVVAAGNSGSPVSMSSPANCNNVISVGATTASGSLAGFSNYGDKARPLTLSAPGESVLSTINTGSTTPSAAGYAYMSGTSMAAPHVAATVALLKSIDPTLTTWQAASILRGTAKAGCAKPACGAGIAQASGAVAALKANIQAAKVAMAQTPSSFALTGDARVGRTLSTGAASSLVSARYSYQWYRDGYPIAGATNSTLTLTPSDLGRILRVSVAGALAGYTWSADSQATPKVRTGVLTKLGSPKASGTFKVGRTVSASKGSWSPTPSSFSYRWLRSGKSISGATKSKYKLTSKDRGKRISVRVTVRKSAYSTTSATSSSHTVKR